MHTPSFIEFTELPRVALIYNKSDESAGHYFDYMRNTSNYIHEKRNNSWNNYKQDSVYLVALYYNQVYASSEEITGDSSILSADREMYEAPKKQIKRKDLGCKVWPR